MAFTREQTKKCVNLCPGGRHIWDFHLGGEKDFRGASLGQLAGRELRRSTGMPGSTFHYEAGRSQQYLSWGHLY